MSHETLVVIAKTVGLAYLMIFLLVVVVHTYRPSRKKAADHAARSILIGEDRPWR